MGIRLKGESLISSKSHDILSEGILPGSIQVPSDGQPIVLMRDIPCTGGYPKIAILNEVDISRISQLPPETKNHLRFTNNLLAEILCIIKSENLKCSRSNTNIEKFE